VESHKGIRIEKSAIQSNLYSLGVIDLGETGVLVSGEIWALGGFRVGSIGRPGSPSSIIRAGYDYTAERKFRGIQEHIDRLEKKLDKLRNRQSLNQKHQLMIRQVEEVLLRMEKSLKDLLDKRYPNRDAVITVFGKVDEGTEIHICELSMRVHSSREAVCFYYDTEGPRIAARSITAADRNPGEEAAGNIDEKEDDNISTEQDESG
jgi:hypothetical protein